MMNVSIRVASVEDQGRVLDDPVEVVDVMWGQDGHAIGGLHRSPGQLRPRLVGAVHHHALDEGVVERDPRPATFEVGHRLGRRRFADVSDVRLVGDAEDHDGGVRE